MPHSNLSPTPEDKSLGFPRYDTSAKQFKPNSVLLKKMKEADSVSINVLLPKKGKSNERTAA